MNTYYSVICSIVFLFIGTLLNAQSDPVLLSIGDNNITLSEFENIYHKNNNVETADHKTKEEYLEYLSITN